MNIKILIKDCECAPTTTNMRQVSQVEHKKKTMLYGPPETDKNNKQTVRLTSTQRQRQNKNTNTNQQNKKTQLNINSKQYRQSQKQMLNQLRKTGQNQASLNMVQNSNMILQKQSQILQQNQRAINHIVNQNKWQEDRDAEIVRNQVKTALDEIRNEVGQIKKIRNEILHATEQFNKNIAQFKGKNMKNQIPQHITQMNNNIKNKAQNTQDHLQGLQNLQAIKNLQNFNMEGYNQAITTLKRQIAQYIKQSQNIQRQLKIRTAKLQKLELPPKFQEQLYKPYQQHLNNRIKNIDLHAIKERVYEKIGAFDYGKFEADVGNIMIQAKGQMANFPIVCKEFQIVVPDIRIDAKQLKNMDIKIPSVLDQYKAARGIKFDDPNKKKQDEIPSKQITTNRLSKTNEIQQRLKQTNSKKPPSIQRITTKPIDLAHQTKLTKQSQRRPTILQNQNKKQKKQLQERIKKGPKQIKKQDEQFQKYLQNRAREQLQILYKEKKQRLQKMQNQLYHEVNNPIYINLDLNKQQLQPKRQDRRQPTSPNKVPSPKKKQKEEQEEYQQQFEEQSNKQPKKQIIQQNRSKNQNIKEIGRDILKQKLKNLLGERNKSPHITHTNFNPSQRPNQQENININNTNERQVQNIAQGFINMINNTLTQVNNNLSRSIEKRIQQNYDRKPNSVQRRSPKKIAVPKLQSFRPPPVFNVNLVQQSSAPQIVYPYPNIIVPQIPQVPLQQKKIVVQNYDQYKIEDEDFEDYQISSDQQQDQP